MIQFCATSDLVVFLGAHSELQRRVRKTTPQTPRTIAMTLGLRSSALNPNKQTIARSAAKLKTERERTQKKVELFLSCVPATRKKLVQVVKRPEVKEGDFWSPWKPILSTKGR